MTKMIAFAPLVALLGLALTWASPTSGGGIATHPRPVHTVFQFDQVGIWIENIAVRQNGDLLFTTVAPNASLYRVEQPWSSGPRTTLVHTFPGISGLTGIAESADDTFVLLGGNTTSPGVPVPGTWSAWRVAFSPEDAEACIEKVVDFHEDVFPNGIQAVPGREGVLLITNSKGGSIIRLDTNSRTYQTAVEIPQMVPLPLVHPPIGINGLKIRDGHMYWCNSFSTTIYRTPMADDGFALASSSSASQAEVVARVDSWMDDFALGDDDGTIWVATNPNNTVVAVGPSGSAVVAGAQGSMDVAGATAAVFGRTGRDRRVLYVTTSGGLAAPVNGSVVEPGKVVALRVERGWL